MLIRKLSLPKGGPKKSRDGASGDMKGEICIYSKI